MSRETRIGILSFLVIAGSIWGYKFIKGQNILSTQQFFYAEFDDVGQMQASTPVYNRGFQIGTVTDIYPKKDDPQRIIIEMEVGKRYKIPKNATAEINQTLMGDKSIEIVFANLCEGDACAKSGAFLTGVFKSIANSALTKDELRDYMTEVNIGLKDVVGELNKMTSDPDNVMGKSLLDLQSTLANLKTTTSLINSDLRKNGKIHGILDNAENVTGSIDTNYIKSLISNANQVAENAKAIDLKGISDKTNQTLEEAQQAIKQLTQTVKNAESAIAELNTLLANVNKGEGSLGKLAKDDQLYIELKDAAEKAKVLLFDIQQRPNRYIPFKSGRKVKKIDKKNPMVLPEEKN